MTDNTTPETQGVIEGLDAVAPTKPTRRRATKPAGDSKTKPAAGEGKTEQAAAPKKAPARKPAAKAATGASETAAPKKAPARKPAAKAATGASETAAPKKAPARKPAAKAAATHEVHENDLAAAGHGDYYNPHAVLGAHKITGGWSVRVRRAMARSVTLVTKTGPVALTHEAHGVWQGNLKGVKMPEFEVETVWADGNSTATVDPYIFGPSLGELDLHLIGEGRHEELWKALGAHVRELAHPGSGKPVAGVAFSVWAPNARAVRVVGDFNYWDGSGHSMRSLGATGVWELFVPGLAAGVAYKFQILGPDLVWRDKADPMARAAQVPPLTASVVTESSFEWSDDAYLAKRANHDVHNSRVSVYELHLGSWQQGKSYRDLAHDLVAYVKDLGFTHVEFMPVAEHPFGGSWGYQVTGYYAPTSRFGSPDDFKFLVNALHEAGIGVIVDWVPAHFPKDDWALARFDGQALYEHEDSRQGEHPDWGTLIFNYGRNEVRNFLVANAVYWLEEFHIDALRVDAVASMLYLDYSREEGQWVPNQFGGRENLEAIAFLQEATATAYRRVPGIMMIAEESTAFSGVTAPTDYNGLGFGLKWNMGWMHDSLQYISKEPIHRQYHHNDLTFSMVYAYSEQFMLPISHDEVVHGKGSLKSKMPGDNWQQLANVRAYLAFQWAHPGKELIFMGSEFGEFEEWNQDASLNWWLLGEDLNRGVQNTVRELNRVKAENPALYALDFDPEGFQWLIGDAAADNVIAFVRRDGEGNEVAVVINFSPVPRYDYRVPLTVVGEWAEIFNSDADAFGGSGVGNLGAVTASDEPMYGFPASVGLTLPPLGAVWLRPVK
ncbi:1,4-alpha-glucan branching protein GlgB [Micrococcales bacterium 31B]|nr:1,4-alpha-glucan branching protein GlgB [Micrococcales bacterium 31B]